jgi:hypothetical protein
MSRKEIFGINQGLLLHSIDDLMVLQHSESICAPVMTKCVAIDPLFMNNVVKFIYELVSP